MSLARRYDRRVSVLAATILATALVVAMASPFALAENHAPSNMVEPGRPVLFGKIGVGGQLSGGMPATGLVEFPRNASQGPDLWYMLAVGLRTRFAQDSAGIAYVSISTNDRTAAQLKFEKVLDSPVVYSAVGLINGSERVEATSEELTVRFENYLRDEGVRPGQVSVDARLEVTSWTGPPPVVVIERDSRIGTTAVSPYPLSLKVEDSHENPDKAEHVVRFTVRGLNGRTVDDVVVLARPGPGLTVSGPAQVAFGTVREPRSGQFTIRYNGKGPRRLELAALSSQNRPSIIVDLEPLPPGSTRWPSVLGFAVALSGAAFVASGAVRRHRG